MKDLINALESCNIDDDFKSGLKNCKTITDVLEVIQKNHSFKLLFKIPQYILNKNGISYNKSGKYVVCDKDLTIKHCDLLVACEKAKVVCNSCYNAYAYDDSFVTLKKWGSLDCFDNARADVYGTSVVSSFSKNVINAYDFSVAYSWVDSQVNSYDYANKRHQKVG